MTLIYGLGHISGAHFNPAVSVGLWMGGRFEGERIITIYPCPGVGGIAGAGILYIIATGKPGAEIGGFAANGFGTNSPGGYGLTAALVTEVVMTMMFLFIILGATDKRAPAGFAGIAIGLGLTLIHLISIPVTNTSVNPARSTSQALFVGDWAIGQLWLFWVAPIIGAIIAGIIYKSLFEKKHVENMACIFILVINSILRS
jgi:aquaporin Z